LLHQISLTSLILLRKYCSGKRAHISLFHLFKELLPLERAHSTPSSSLVNILNAIFLN